MGACSETLTLWWYPSFRADPAGHHHAAAVIGGELYLVGGLERRAQCLSRECIGEVQIYNPAANSWRLGAKLPWKTSGSVSAALIGSRFYACGGVYELKHKRFSDGYRRPGNPRQCGYYTPPAKQLQADVDTADRGSWTMVASMLQGVDHASAGTDGSNLFIFGGRSDGVNVNDAGIDLVQVYDPQRNSWRRGPAPLPFGRGGMGAAVFLGGRFFVFGGETKLHAEDSNAVWATGLYR